MGREPAPPSVRVAEASIDQCGGLGNPPRVVRRRDCTGHPGDPDRGEIQEVLDDLSGSDPQAYAILQEAMFREGMHIIAEGAATTEEVDAAITDGPGMRLAWMGPMFSFHLGAGRGGMRYHFDHYGMDQPWTDLAAPELTNELVGRMVDGTAEQQGEQSYDAWLQARDRFLLKLYALKKEVVSGY